MEDAEYWYGEWRRERDEKIRLEERLKQAQSQIEFWKGKAGEIDG